ncbi:Rad52/Rad22 family DNA repair protein [Roseisolibacter agri]|uniref:Rad52/Rad22 family DNA repair protein n=1 Tax=Roseisolibacter agri TaxID=2014610 RepID=UPI0031F30B70
MQLDRLRDPFVPTDIEWRVQTAGEKNGKPWARVLAYVTNRAIMDRLDEVAGPGRWQNVFKEGPAGGVVCGLAIYVDAVVGWVTKWDGAENTDVEPVKGGLSGAMKRAAVQWGIGRYLYDLEEGWAVVSDSGRFSAKTKDGKWFKWDPPVLPNWAQPQARAATAAQVQRIEQLLAAVKDEKVTRQVRARLTNGLTEQAADEAVRFLEARAA